MTDLHQFEARLRHDMGRTAQTVTPPPRALERAIDTARARGDISPAPRWPVRRWIMPVAAAATVLIVVSAMLLVHTTKHAAPAGPRESDPIGQDHATHAINLDNRVVSHAIHVQQPKLIGRVSPVPDRGTSVSRS